MKDNEYAYAVASIRSNEASLLATADVEQLVLAENYQSAVRILEEKGWIDSDNHDVSLALKNQAKNTWKLLSEVAPNINELDFLIVKNDFHNIKAVLKAFVSLQTKEVTNTKLENSFIYPSSFDPEQIKDAVFNKKLEDLPESLKDAVQKTYDVLIRTSDGQLADIMLDAMALNTILEKAEKTDNEFIKKMAELICVTSNIKIAFRASLTGKDKQFLETALCETKTMDKDLLIEAALKGADELIGYISTTQYSDASENLKISTTSFEKWCDDILMSHIADAKYICLGVEPLIAYYIAKDAEIKTIRIILSCKHNKLSPEVIKERVRKLYV